MIQTQYPFHLYTSILFKLFTCCIFNHQQSHFGHLEVFQSTSFIYGCAGSSLLRAGILQSWQAGATLRCGAWASHRGGFFLLWSRALGTLASVVVAHGLSSCGSQALERRLSSCGAQAQLLHGMWDLPGPGLEPMSPALAGGFLTTVPPGKSEHIIF